MASVGFKVEIPRRQAILRICDMRQHGQWGQELVVKERVPVFVWPIPTLDGHFIVEHQDGSCTYAHPSDLTFLCSKELFDQYDWSEA